MNKNYTIRDICEIAVYVALALILNLPVLKIHISTDAGSISFLMIPLCILALRHTWWKSLIAISIVFSLPASFMGGHGIITYPFDYALAYSGIVILSFLKKKILSKNKISYLYLVISLIIAILVRYLFSTISSIVIFNFKLVPALIYNAPYIFISGAILIVVMVILLKPLKIINDKYPN